MEEGFIESKNRARRQSGKDLRKVGEEEREWGGKRRRRRTHDLHPHQYSVKLRAA